jgi:hypothetical protein
MNADDRMPPVTAGRKGQDRADRQARLAEALRENLRKRKQQTRRREDIAKTPNRNEPDGA